MFTIFRFLTLALMMLVLPACSSLARPKPTATPTEFVSPAGTPTPSGLRGIKPTAAPNPFVSDCTPVPDPGSVSLYADKTNIAVGELVILVASMEGMGPPSLIFYVRDAEQKQEKITSPFLDKNEKQPRALTPRFELVSADQPNYTLTMQIRAKTPGKTQFRIEANGEISVAECGKYKEPEWEYHNYDSNVIEISVVAR